MKKILTSLSLFILLIISFSTSIGYCYYPYYKHEKCFTARWNYFTQNNSYGYYYDTESIEKENRFLPFQDRIIKVWIARHINLYYGCDTYKKQYELNIDKKTYKVLNSKNPAEKPIEPDSVEEKFLDIAINLY